MTQTPRSIFLQTPPYYNTSTSGHYHRISSLFFWDHVWSRDISASQDYVLRLMVGQSLSIRVVLGVEIIQADHTHNTTKTLSCSMNQSCLAGLKSLLWLHALFVLWHTLSIVGLRKKGLPCQVNSICHRWNLFRQSAFQWIYPSNLHFGDFPQHRDGDEEP